jgi:putative Ca2+/H+ antiporter (TMEM165/GDT1 family)
LAISLFLTTFALVFLAELGDKTSLAAVALATRYPWKKAFLGIALAFALLDAVAVAVGSALFRFLPHGWIEAASAALFLFFGARALLSREARGEESRKSDSHGPVVTAFLLILLAELGDKTQMVIASLAAQHAHPLVIFAAATLALWLVSLLGLLVGAQLSKRLPVVWVHRAAGIAFLCFGLFTAWQAASALGLFGN